MAKTKPSSKKQKQNQKRGVDFKKIKRKLGRKLPTPKNATNTEIKSKAIVLPEQTVASEKAGFALSKKGLTLSQLLQRASHDNSKVRKDALLGMKDLFIRHPHELKEHAPNVVRMLSGRFRDDDKVVRDTLYQLLKSVILPGCKEDNQVPMVSLMMMDYIFIAMTHLALDVRLMAFKFLDIVVESHPPLFILHAGKILQNYEDILRRNQEKVKLKSVLSCLEHCLSLLPHVEGYVETSKKEVPERMLLHAYEDDDPIQSSTELSVIFEKLQSLLPILVNFFKDSIAVTHGAPPLDVQSFDCMLSTLRSINLALQFFIHETLKASPYFQRLNGRDGMNMWCNSLGPLLLRHLLSSFPLTKPPLLEEDDERYLILNVGITEIFVHVMEWIHPPMDVVEKFLKFIEDTLPGNREGGSMGYGKARQGKQNLRLIAFIPKVVWKVCDWKLRLLKVFTDTFQHCHPESSMKLACLKAIRDMLFSKEDLFYVDLNNSELLDHLVRWIRMLPELLVCIGNMLPSVSKVALELLLRFGQRCAINKILEREYVNLQYPEGDDKQCPLQQFYSADQGGGICYGPFIKLPPDSQMLSIHCLSYFSHLGSSLLTSITRCCLSNELDWSTLSCIMGVMESSFEAGRLSIADYINFLITLVCCFPVSQGIGFDSSDHGIFKLITRDACSSLSRMGDNHLILQLLEKLIGQEITLKPPLHNACGMLKVINRLDSAPSRLSKQSIITLSSFLLGYLIDVVQRFPLDLDEPVDSINLRARRYYILPCHILLVRSDELLNLVLSGMKSSILNDACYGSSHPSNIDNVVSALLWLHRDDKVKKVVGDLSDRLRALNAPIQPE